METLYLPLVVLTVLILIGITFIILVRQYVSSVKRKDKPLWDGIDSLANDLGKEIDNIHDKIDDRLKSMENDYTSININTEGEVDALHHIFNLRLSKVEKKIKKILEKGRKPIQKK
jgi:predicted transcriptional regulator